MWPISLTHHPRSEAGRCTWVGPLPVCRRCLATWPLCAATIVAGLLRPLPVAGGLELGIWLLPPVLDYVAVHALGWPYKAGRTWLFGSLLGIGLGRLFHRYLLDPSDPLTWRIMAATALPCLAAALAYHFMVKKRAVL